MLKFYNNLLFFGYIITYFSMYDKVRYYEKSNILCNVNFVILYFSVDAQMKYKVSGKWRVWDGLAPIKGARSVKVKLVPDKEFATMFPKEVTYIAVGGVIKVDKGLLCPITIKRLGTIHISSGFFIFSPDISSQYTSGNQGIH